MRGSYAKEKIGSAVHILATGRDGIKERIWDAYMQFHPLKETNFPDDLKSKWNDLYNRLTSEEPTYNSNGEVTNDRVQNTLKKLTDDECVDIAELIVDLDFEIGLQS
jgi:hypothetical protein